MQHLHDLIARLYPDWPRALEGHRVQIYLADEARGWLHVETDGGGLDSPVKPSAVHHLHVSAEWTASDGTPQRPVVCMSVLAPSGLITDEWGPLAFTPACVPFLYVLTAFGRSDDTSSMQRVWTRVLGGKLVCRQSARAVGLRMLRAWDEQIGRQWRP